MGRRKIEIKAIKDDRNRSVTFLKRKGGLFKKAHELSVLCSVDVAVFVFGNNKKLYEYSSADMRDLITRYQYHGGPNEHKGPSDFNGGNDDDDDEEGDGTPSTRRPRSALDAPAVPQPAALPSNSPSHTFSISSYAPEWYIPWTSSPSWTHTAAFGWIATWFKERCSSHGAQHGASSGRPSRHGLYANTSPLQ
uniref:MADS-box MEF2 type transcription factor MIG1 n=1 Tax=Bionectria ochroleuca TaxID=29856 RepID=A0A8H7NNG2_BIOOC